MAKQKKQQSDFMSNKIDSELGRLEKDIASLYSNVQKEISADFQKFTDTFKKEYNANRIKVAEGKMTQEEFSLWTQRKTVQSDLYKSTIDSISKTLVKADQAAMALVNGKLPSVVAQSYNFVQALGFSAAQKAGISAGTFQVYNARSVQALMKGDKNVLKPKVDVAEDTRWNHDKINKAITTSIVKGDSIPDVAKRLQGVTNMDRSSAVRNARTAMTSAENLGRSEAADDLKEKGIPVEEVWSATYDNRTRDSHLMLDGTVRDENGFFGADFLAHPLRYPADPEGDPEEIYNCRCRLNIQLKGIDHSNDEELYKQFMQENYSQDWENLQNNQHYQDMQAEKEAALDRKERLLNEQAEKQAETSIVPDNLPASTIEVIGEKGNPIPPETLAETVNPHYLEAGYTDNCQRCVVGYELGRRGYDVEAMAFDGSYLTTQSVFDISTQFRSGESYGTYITGEKYNPRFAQKEYPFNQSPKTTANSIIRAMTDWGDGARATMEISWRRGGAHVVNVENTKGKVRIIDAQSGMIFDNIEGYLSRTKCAETELRRTDILKIRDNIPPDILERICKKRK